MFDSVKNKMYLFNYYIMNGSFTNLSKQHPQLYRDILTAKSNEEEYADLTVTEYIEAKLIPNRVNRDISADFLRDLYEHYNDYPTLSNSPVAKKLEGRLRRLAQKNEISLAELKEKLDTQQIYPLVMNRILNRYNVRDYNNIIQMIAMGIMMETRLNSNIKYDILTDFHSKVHMEMYEPGYATFLESRVPTYGGSLPHDVEGVRHLLSGSKYYGTDSKLDTIPSIIDDIIYALKGYIPRKNLKPSISFKLSHLMRHCGNLNRIGIDELGVLSELDELSMNLGFTTIAQFLENEGFKFTPVSSDRVSIIPCKKNYEVIIDGYDEGQIIIDSTLKDALESMNLVQTLNVTKGPVNGQQDVPVLVYIYDGKPKLAYQLITKNTAFTFYNGNPLDLTTENLTGKGV